MGRERLERARRISVELFGDVSKPHRSRNGSFSALDVRILGGNARLSILWAGSDWKERGELVWSFLVTFLSLIAAATVLSPHWMSGFWAATRAYRSYGPGATGKSAAN